MVVIVKRQGHKEEFDEKKTYGSIYAACASAHYGEQECEKIAEQVLKSVKVSIKGKKQITSVDIRKKITVELKKKDGDLVFFYEHHLPNLKKL